MQKLTLDPGLRAQFTNLKSEVELCDETGNTVGYFLPSDWHRTLYAWANAQVTDAELEAARQQTGGASLADILARIDKPCATR